MRSRPDNSLGNEGRSRRELLRAAATFSIGIQARSASVQNLQMFSLSLRMNGAQATGYNGDRNVATPVLHRLARESMHDEFLPAREYIRRAGLAHYKEINVPVGTSHSPWGDW